MSAQLTRLRGTLALMFALAAGSAAARAPPSGPTMRGDGPPPAAKPFSTLR
jgi:hypothetical protein